MSTSRRTPQLVDYDRHNNSLTKLRDKKEKSLSDEKNLFKVEQDHEAATAEYEHYNGICKEELPTFLVLGTKFIDPLFHSFYFMQLNIFYMCAAPPSPSPFSPKSPCADPWLPSLPLGCSRSSNLSSTASTT